MEEKNKRDNAVLLGLGADTSDHHQRITRGENFYLYGGSSQTHDSMVEEVLLFNELLKKNGKALHDLSEKEYYAMVREVKQHKKFKSMWLYNLNPFNHWHN